VKRGVLLAGTAAAFIAPGLPTAVRADDTVTVGIANSLSDVPFFIGLENGYFHDAGLDVKLTAFDSGARMMAPLGAGQIDVAAGSASAGLYNAVARNVELHIVADKGSAPIGYGFTAILVRSDLVKSGKYKSPRDLKGLKVAESAQGVTTNPVLDIMMRKDGLTYADVQHVYMGFPQHVLAFESGSIDASLTAEPSVALAVATGAAVRVAGTDFYYPNQNVAAVLYGGPFIKQRRDAGIRFMVAYLRAVRFYTGALKDGRFGGKNAAAVLDILVKYTALKDRAVYAAAVPQVNDPNGKVNEASLKTDLAFYRSQGWIEGNATVDDVYDPSIAQAAVKQLGVFRG
jgi:NitT/TauT family transport system substrate-binding protein